MLLSQGLFSWLAALAVVVALFGIVEGREEIIERQNPSFITVLPTSASDPLVVVTTTSVPTVAPSHPEVLTTFSAVPLPTTTAATSRSSIFSSDSASPLATSTSSPAANASNATSADEEDRFINVGDAFFGMVPTPSPDAPVVSIFSIIFLSIAIAHWLYYQSYARKAKRAPKKTLSRLIVLFCLARVVACILRLVWITAPTSAVVIFTAVVAENAGTIFLIVVNFHLTKRMISFCNLKYSLYARSVTKKVSNVTIIVIFAAIFLLNTFGVALFEVQVTSGRDPTTEAHLVQASELLLIAFCLTFNFAVITTILTTSWAPVDRLRVKIITYFLGAGLLTLFSQFMRLIATFLIWKPVTHISAVLLSKPIYYLSGFGTELLILLLYTLWETRLLGRGRDSFLPQHKSAPDRFATQTPEDYSRPQSHASTTRILQMSSAPIKEVGDEAAVDDDEGSKNNYRSTVICSSPIGVSDEDVEKPAGNARPWTITVHKTFTISTSTARGSQIGKAI